MPFLSGGNDCHHLAAAAELGSIPLAIQPLEREQPCAPTLARDAGTLGCNLLSGRINQVTHHLPADRWIRVQQPLDDVHGVLGYWLGMPNQEQIAHFRQRPVEERRVIEERIAAREGDIMDTVRDEKGVGDVDDEAQRLYDREDGLWSAKSPFELSGEPFRPTTITRRPCRRLRARDGARRCSRAGTTVILLAAPVLVPAGQARHAYRELAVAWRLRVASWYALRQDSTGRWRRETYRLLSAVGGRRRAGRLRRSRRARASS